MVKFIIIRLNGCVQDRKEAKGLYKRKEEILKKGEVVLLIPDIKCKYFPYEFIYDDLYVISLH